MSQFTTGDALYFDLYGRPMTKEEWDAMAEKAERDYPMIRVVKVDREKGIVTVECVEETA